MLQIFKGEILPGDEVTYTVIGTYPWTNSADALAYLQSLPAGLYFAQLTTSTGYSVVAQVP